jgi:probable HAF family extracellular repeat protein
MQTLRHRNFLPPRLSGGLVTALRRRFVVRTFTIIAGSFLAVSNATGAASPQPNGSHSWSHVRYKVIDMGTLGGPAGYVSFPGNSFPVLNGRGVTVGTSATSVRILPKSNPFVCGGSHGGVPYLFHAFAWHGGIVTDLGALPPNDMNCSLAGSVNARGEIAGTSEVNAIDPILGVKELHAVVWRSTGISDLGTLGGTLSLGVGINDAGQIVGGTLNATLDPVSMFDFQLGGSSNGTQTRAFLWEHGAMRDLGTLGGPDAFAGYINERGEVAGFSYTDSTPNPVTGVPTTHPFLWTNGMMKDLGTLGGTLAFSGLNDMAGGLNNRGQVVGESTLAGDQTVHPFLWDGRKLVDLYTSVAGGNPLTADALTDAGAVVGGAAFPKKHVTYDPYILKDGVASDLGNPAGDCHGRAFAINALDQVVGNAFLCNFNYHDAFLWENGSSVNLNDLIPPNSPVHLTTAFAINDRGEIAGVAVPRGVDPNLIYTKGRAYLLIPCAEMDTCGE